MGVTYEGSDWSYGRIAFETYKNHVGGKAYNGNPIPGWDDMTDLQRDAWDLAATGVIQEHERDDGIGLEW
jgi:hypothetical protein